MIIEEYKRGNFILSKMPMTPDNIDFIHSLPAYKNFGGPTGRGVIFRPVASNLDLIMERFGSQLEWRGEAQNFIEQYMKMRQEENLINSIKHDPSKIDDSGYEYKTTPFQHQRECFGLSRDLNWFAVLGEMGTGKTKILIDTIAYLWKMKKIDCVIVIAPNGVHENWITIEIPIHLPDWCIHDKDFYSTSHGKKRMSSIYDILLNRDKLSIISMNVEAFSSKKAKQFYENIIFSRKPLVIIDESTVIKNPQAKRSTYLIQSTKEVQFKRIATGSPLTKSVEDLFCQFKFLSPQILGFDTVTTYRAQFCHIKHITIKDKNGDPLKDRFGNERKAPLVTGYKNLNELKRKIAPYSYRITKKEALPDLPDKTYKFWGFNLSPQQKKAYDELKEEFQTEINGKHVSSEWALVRLTRLQEITCGFYTDENGEKHVFDKNPRLEALKSICEEVEAAQEKAIIWARFKHDFEAIKSILGNKAVFYHGGISAEGRRNAVESFNNDPLVPYMVGSLTSNSGAVRGHTWTAKGRTTTAIYYSNTHDLDARLQSEDRFHRIGMGAKALYIDLMATGTADRPMITSLREKKSIADIVTGDTPGNFLRFINEA